MEKLFQPIHKILERPYASILGYPGATKKQIEYRYIEIKELGVESVSFFGNTEIKSVSILGKGHNGLIILAKKNHKKVAVKIRRIDSQRSTMHNESEFLRMVNRINIGPKWIANSKNFIVMEYLDGELITEWISNVISGKEIRHMVRSILIDCYNLDKFGIDHGELNNISKHVIIREKPTIVDFENASSRRRMSNVTSVIQYMYISSAMSQKINYGNNISKEKLIKLLRTYKNNITAKNFNEILTSLELQ